MKQERIPAVDRKVDKGALPFNAKTSTRTVADPFSTTGGMIEVTSSLRDDPLLRMYARQQIREHQFAVGQYVQHLFELAAIGGIQAMDPSKEPVDGRGAFVEPITQQHVKAVDKLTQAREQLGVRGYAMVRAVLADRLFIEQIALSNGITSQRAREQLGARFRECLDDLAGLYGYVGAGPEPKNKKDHHAKAAKHADNPKLRAAINLSEQMKDAA